MPTAISAARIQSNFVAWAQTQPDVRAAFVVGSQARRDHPCDRWSDVDIILFDEAHTLVTGDVPKIPYKHHLLGLANKLHLANMSNHIF